VASKHATKCTGKRGKKRGRVSMGGKGMEQRGGGKEPKWEEEENNHLSRFKGVCMAIAGDTKDDTASGKEHRSKKKIMAMTGKL